MSELLIDLIYQSTIAHNQIYLVRLIFHMRALMIFHILILRIFCPENRLKFDGLKL